MENTPKYRSVCQNTAEMHPTYWLVKHLKSTSILPPILGHKRREMLPECEYEGHFFRGNPNDYINCTFVIGKASNIMVLKTLSDCTRCWHIAECDAHISGGNHKHLEEPNPCELVF
jgi:hypothetical protein